MPIEKKPANPLPKNFVPFGGLPYKVGDQDSWSSIAAKLKIDVWDLIEFNFKTRDPDEVNWYLHWRVGCKKATGDQKNWMFSKLADPGIIFFPTIKEPAKQTPTPFPIKVCPDELAAAQATLTRSKDIADTILKTKATSDMPYWFARLYQYITMQEIADRELLTYPCFMLHFIPIFYDTYAIPAEAFKGGAKGKIPVHWQDHFAMAGLVVDPSQLTVWVNAVAKSLATGVAAHIKGDMADALAAAHKSFSAKYTGVPPLDTFKDDFFKTNMKVFEKVRLLLVNELVNRGSGLAMIGKSVNPKFASEAAAAVNVGLNISEIYKWREEAWKKAKEKLGQ